MKLYHATSISKLPSIKLMGLNSHSYFSSSEDIAEYYLETVRDEGEEGILLIVDSDDLDHNFCSPDRPGLDEPITTVLEKSEEQVSQQWDSSAKTWLDCVQIIGSFRYDTKLSASLIHVDYHGEIMPLIDFDNMFMRPEKQRLKL